MPPSRSRVMRRTLLLAAVAAHSPRAQRTRRSPTGKPDLRGTSPSSRRYARRAMGRTGTARRRRIGASPGRAPNISPCSSSIPVPGLRSTRSCRRWRHRSNPTDESAGGLFLAAKAKGPSRRRTRRCHCGQKLYRGGDIASGMPACAACHSPNGAGVPKNYPRLAGQYAEYTYAQLKAFRDGERARTRKGRITTARSWRRWRRE